MTHAKWLLPALLWLAGCILGWHLTEPGIHTVAPEPTPRAETAERNCRCCP